MTLDLMATNSIKQLIPTFNFTILSNLMFPLNSHDTTIRDSLELNTLSKSLGHPLLDPFLTAQWVRN